MTPDEMQMKIAEMLEGKLKELDLSNAVSSILAKRLDEMGIKRPGDLPPVDEKDWNMSRKAEDFFRGVVFGRRTCVHPTNVKALSEGTDSAGGYLVPTEYIAELVKRLPELSELYPYVRNIPVKSNAGTMPALLTDIEMSWDEAENAALDETDPVFTQVSYSIHRCNALSKMSAELVEDADPGMIGVITELFTEAVAAERDKMIATGNGSTQPQGLASATVSVVSVSGSITFAKLREIEFLLKKKYRKGARWVVGNTALRYVMSLKDDNGRPLFNGGNIDAGVQPTLLGYPISQQDDLASTEMYLGDLKRYLWFDRRKVTIGQTDVGGDAFAYNQVWTKLIERCDGKLALGEAFVKGVAITG